jgi:hypothetical protein
MDTFSKDSELFPSRIRQEKLYWEKLFIQQQQKKWKRRDRFIAKRMQGTKALGSYTTNIQYAFKPVGL